MEEPPTIEAQYPASVGTTEAVLRAEINPHFAPDTTFYVEYGTASCKEGGCATQPAPPGAPLGASDDLAVTTAGIPLGGLEPGTTYHFRFVAISGEFTTKGLGEEEAEGTFTTYRSGPRGLPDGRAYEMVSPPDKNGAEVGAPGGTGGAANSSAEPILATADGEALTYHSFTAFGEDPKGAPGASQYLSRRGADASWSTDNIVPPSQGGFVDPLRGFSSDLTMGAVVVREPSICCGAVSGIENLFLQENETGALQLLTPGEGPRGCIAFAGSTDGFERLIFAVQNGTLLPGDPAGSGFNLYEWSEGEGLRLVSVLPNGEPAAPVNVGGFGAGVSCKMTLEIVHNAISADGSRIFWTAIEGTARTLYTRLNGTETIQLDATQGGPGPAGGGQFWAASDDGSVAFFTAKGRLTADATAEGNASDLYRYDLEAPEGERLTDITVDPTPGSDPAAVQGVLGAAEDGSHVYFVARGVLEEGAQAGQNNLYLWRAGEGVRFVATLSSIVNPGSGDSVDASDWSTTPEFRTARTTPSGKHLAFLSAAPLTGYDNEVQEAPGCFFDNVGVLGGDEHCRQAYLYDAEADELTCASCNPANARPLGPTHLTTWRIATQQPRYLSDDGQRLFFETLDTLDPRDTNKARDLYEFERPGSGDCSAASTTFNSLAGGCVSLLSTGRSARGSYFIDASVDGRDVFLSTSQALLPWDEDGRYDIYDARIGGKAVPPPSPAPGCFGEACRPAGPPPPAAPAPGSAAFSGEGNAKPQGRRCPKGKRKVRRGGKVRCVPRKRRAANRNRRAQR